MGAQMLMITSASYVPEGTKSMTIYKNGKKYIDLEYSPSGKKLMHREYGEDGEVRAIQFNNYNTNDDLDFTVYLDNKRISAQTIDYSDPRLAKIIMMRRDIPKNIVDEQKQFIQNLDDLESMKKYVHLKNMMEHQTAIDYLIKLDSLGRKICKHPANREFDKKKDKYYRYNEDGSYTMVTTHLFKGLLSDKRYITKVNKNGNFEQTEEYSGSSENSDWKLLETRVNHYDEDDKILYTAILVRDKEIPQTKYIYKDGLLQKRYDYDENGKKSGTHKFYYKNGILDRSKSKRKSYNWGTSKDKFKYVMEYYVKDSK